MSQQIYLIHCEGHYKIGITDNLEHRIATMQTGNPFPLELIAVFSAENIKRAEAQIHELLSDLRGSGEWFRAGETEMPLIWDAFDAAGCKRADADDSNVFRTVRVYRDTAALIRRIAGAMDKTIIQVVHDFAVEKAKEIGITDSKPQPATGQE